MLGAIRYLATHRLDERICTHHRFGVAVGENERHLGAGQTRADGNGDRAKSQAGVIPHDEGGNIGDHDPDSVSTSDAQFAEHVRRLRRQTFQLCISQMLIIEDDRIAIWKQTRTDDDVFTNIDGSTNGDMEAS